MCLDSNSQIACALKKENNNNNKKTKIINMHQVRSRALREGKKMYKIKLSYESTN